ncbi:MAG: [Fe-Fe] hydrogenase large subunit C-terminal domain-containing protein [Bacillota bacterium]
MISKNPPDLAGGKVILWTNPARCRDCNRCVRGCLAKAIRKEGHQAKVMPEKCLLCGRCIRECPQGAKVYLDETLQVAAMIEARLPVIASLAPSYLAAFSPAEIRGLPGVLRQLGFALVTETAVGAELSARAARIAMEANPQGQYIYTACPAVVSYIQQKKPELSPLLLPVASPMIAHGRYLKATYGQDTKVVFIGPCLAKKAEALGEPLSVDAVLTFEELKNWLQQKKLNPLLAEESAYDDVFSAPATLFPLNGGFARTAGLSTDHLDRLMVTASGIEGVREAVEYVAGTRKPLVLEALMCPGGCLGGVGMGRQENHLALRQALLSTIDELTAYPALQAPLKAEEIKLDLTRNYYIEPSRVSLPDETQIRQVLAKLGKHEPADELNCGACGYDTCKEKALAVLAGMAEIEMCLPFMRHHAEMQTDAIIINSPSAIVILDRDLKIVHANPKFQEMFMTSDYCRGKHINYFINPEPFQRVLQGQTEIFNETVHHNSYGLYCQQLVYKIGVLDGVQLVGILVNLTRSKKQESELDLLRKETLTRAEQVVDRQVEIAQEVTRLLGRSAAETSAILAALTDLVKRKEGD